jgi:hypothetical protein
MAAAPLQSVTISRGPPAAPAMDYGALLREGLALVQAWSGSIWTDYNEHDPGVTILEQLCYALTELAYRAAFPVADILADPDGSLGTVASVLYRPSRILPAEPVTLADYRRLLIDRVEGLANVWLEPRFAAGAPTGLYRIRAYVAPPVPGLYECGDEDRRVVERAARTFVRHRALGEDFEWIRPLTPVRTVFSATVSIDGSAPPEEVMAQLIQRLACYLAPEPRRRPLSDLVAQGLSLAEIFEGPLLVNGFIAAADLVGRRRRVSAAELADQAAGVAGVLAVDGAGLWAEPDRHGEARLKDGEYFGLDAQLDAEPMPIQLIVDGRPVPVDRIEVRRRLKRLWDRHRRTYRLGPEFRRLFPAPTGCYRELDRYMAVAGQFPAVYGIGPRGLPPEAGPERRAQAKQLEGFLALFDRLMADYLDRLANIRPLIAADPLDQSVFERPLAEIAPWMAPLLIDGGPDVETYDGRSVFTTDHQNRLADFLLALYGEDPDALIPDPPAGDDRGPVRRRLEIKRDLLHRLIAAGKGRGRGLDYRASRRRRHVAGVELRSRIMLGADACAERRRRPRLIVIEHVLLRRRGDAGPCCDPPPPPGDAMIISALVHLPGESGCDPLYRSRIETMIRANTPAHIAVRTLFVSREDWVRFRRLLKFWRKALREDMAEAIDCVSDEIRRRLDGWAGDQEGE